MTVGESYGTAAESRVRYVAAVLGVPEFVYSAPLVTKAFGVPRASVHFWYAALTCRLGCHHTGLTTWRVGSMFASSVVHPGRLGRPLARPLVTRAPQQE